jgi:hypothetical protein
MSPPGPGERLPIRVLVRTNVDWRAMGPVEFAAQDDRTRPLEFILTSKARAAVELWDQVFDVDFFTYRAGLRDIAETALESAGADHLTVGFDDFATDGGFEAWWSRGDDELVIAFDDDDLLTSDITRLTDGLSENAGVLIWPRTSLGVGADGGLAWGAATVRCILATNCAIRKSFLTSRFDPEEGQRILADHRRANDAVADTLDIDPDDFAVPGFRRLRHHQVTFVHEQPSVKLIHIGSIQFLVDAMRRPDPVGYLRSIDLRVPRPVPFHARVLAPQLAALDELWASLRGAA